MLTREEADSCVSVEFNPVRAGFAGGRDVWTRDVLNLGVSPSTVIRLVCHAGGLKHTMPAGCIQSFKGGKSKIQMHSVALRLSQAILVTIILILQVYAMT